MDTLGGGRRVAKAASPRLALARKLVIGIKGITHSKIQARQAHLDNLFALASASRAVCLHSALPAAHGVCVAVVRVSHGLRRISKGGLGLLCAVGMVDNTWSGR